MNENKKIQKQELNLAEVKKIAQEMIDFIKQTKLSVPIQNKQYIQVDGWQFLSISMDLTPVITEVQNISNEKELKYFAKCELLNKNQKIISIGYGLCSNKESKKRNFDEYAVCSMAQTRAIGKAYRNRFGFIAKLAGFEPTPVEEMTEVFKSETNLYNPENNKSGKKSEPLPNSLKDKKIFAYQTLKSKNFTGLVFKTWDKNIQNSTEKNIDNIIKTLSKMIANN